MYPHERSLVEEMKDQPFVIVGVNSDNEERYRKAIETEDITWRSFFDGGSTGGPIAMAWGVSGWPTTYLLDHEGVIRFKGVRGKAVDKALEELLPNVPGWQPPEGKQPEEKTAEEETAEEETAEDDEPEGSATESEDKDDGTRPPSSDDKNSDADIPADSDRQSR
jgi:hypothetical protein